MSNCQSKTAEQKNILMVGDLLSRNLSASVVKNVTDMKFRWVEAATVEKEDDRASFRETVETELEREPVDTLVIQGGTEEVTNLDITGDVSSKMESMKKTIKTSFENLFNIAENSLENNSGLQRVVLLKRMFRCDINDPDGLKSKLSEYGNRVFEDTWLDRGCPKNIIIAQQDLTSNA